MNAVSLESAEWIDDLDEGSLFEADEPTIPDGDDVEAREWVNRKLRRIAFLKRERAIQAQVIANERARIDKYERDTIGQLDRAIDYHEAPVLAWAEHMHEVDPKTKSRQFPAGVVKSRRLPDQIDIDDEVALPWLLENRPDLVRVKTEVNKAEVRGEADLFDIPGIAVTTGRIRYSVEVNDV